ncbi:DNA-binding response OmpR family regulator [Peptoniphilus koenoeneniae]|uniref:DNA-binding response OmpR family regulator n=1 Tax=Peptoniphilus koenoeneniae TaxID=507751 RepID=A0ABU0ARX5_9FIRM|nr:response regulator transcription factor [Peptoniphilus koenoeneniae]MDQ0274007.1 DNA-binding response OmpR family regulator [Peptoniphilus koenoeneniae]
MKILVVEDEKDLNKIIVKHLLKQDFIVDYAYNGLEALDFVAYTKYDLIILDIMMPEMDGFEFAKKIRDEENDTPILFLTAKDTIEDRVRGLDLGGDDYLIKPFDFKELLARIRAIVRRKNGESSNIIRVFDLSVDINKKQVKRGSKLIDLTAKEYQVLEYLLRNKNQILTRENIRDGVWPYDSSAESNVIDVLIKNIRKKIDIENSNKLITTKRGLGYGIFDQ